MNRMQLESLRKNFHPDFHDDIMKLMGYLLCMCEMNIANFNLSYFSQKFQFRFNLFLNFRGFYE